ncbi:extensin family protein [Sphingomonas bacterium]|uniref:extensin family protein n=1 Tax=Sphingomonas bacterium TaxID=1895847 RepID=UPI0020C60157|nr:extensin family protein [Sphingomonas bacterium]
MASINGAAARLPFAAVLPLMMAISLSGCGRHSHPRSTARPAATPVPAETPAAMRKCLADLSALGAKVQVLPDRIFPNGCSATSAVKLVAIGIPVTNLGAVKCGLALPLTQWVTQAVQSAAHDRLKGYVVRIESFGSFACRPINNVAGNRLSEHGRANAVDIAAFVLADGRRISVTSDWNGADPDRRAFLRQVRDAACRRFATVLSPDFNAYHHDHLHFDMGNGHLCR